MNLGSLQSPMDNIVRWNIRGLNGLNKREDIVLFLNKHSIGMARFLETKVKTPNHEKVANDICRGWSLHLNFQQAEKDRIWIA